MISLKNITKKYGEKVVYDNFSLEIEENKVTAILGESGSGKTTLLNVLAKLIPFEGSVSGDVSPVSFVFQKDRLIPNLTAAENLLLVNKNINPQEVLAKVGLSGCANLYPKNLSSGMARRVAILRAFIYPSKTILMDEPFINLDVALKYSLIDYFKKMQEADGRTAVTVTHDIKEAVTIADRIVVLSKGNIVYDDVNITENTEKELFDLMLKIGNKI